jgi:hypothetical protein
MKEGVWKHAQTLVAADGASGDRFGASIAISGNYVIITAPFAKVNGKTWQGAAYAFVLSTNSCEQTQKIVASEGVAFDTFGTCVQLNSKWAFISAGGANRAGNVMPYRVFAFRYVPRRSEGEWVESSILDAPDPADSTSAFGTALALSASSLLIGSRTATVDGRLGQGAAYLYNYVRPNRWILESRLTPKDDAPRENFGSSVALDVNGREILVGAVGTVVNGNVSQGAVYRFNRQDGDWRQVQTMTASDGAALNLFGASMSLSKNRVLIGAYGAGGYTGAAYAFVLRAGAWQQMKVLKASDGVPGDVFGYYLSLSETYALVGAYAASIDGDPQQGAAYFFAMPQTSLEDGQSAPTADVTGRSKPSASNTSSMTRRSGKSV